MTCELPDIVRFLTDHAPFMGAEKTGLEALAASAEVLYVKSGDMLLTAGDRNCHLYQVRSGAVSVYEDDKDMIARLDEGSFFAYPSLLRGGTLRNGVRACEDSLIYRYSAQAFERLLTVNSSAARFFHSAEADRLRAALAFGNAQRMNRLTTHAETNAQTNTDGAGLNTPSLATALLDDLITRAPITAPADTLVQSLAQTMMRDHVSTVLITDSGGRLVGIVSDKDIRRLVADGFDAATKASDIMTPDPVTFASDQGVLDALLTMLDGGFRHAPVLDAQGLLIGLVSGTDMMHRLATSSLQLSRLASTAENEDRLVEVAQHQSRMLVDLMKMGLAADRVAAMISATGRAIHRRAFELAIADLGPPPIPVAFIVLGSLARREQTGVSDQDNGFILDDSYDPAIHDAYFKPLAHRISDTLDACGYEYCGGDIMATNPKWRQSLGGWIGYFKNWTSSPDPKALMHASIFFDRAFVAGDDSLFDRLTSATLELTKNRGIFLAQLTENALSSKPPLGFFRQFVVAQHGDEARSFDIKKEGLVPLQDLIRVHALRHGLDAVSTLDRITALRSAKALAADDLDELRDAFEFLMQVRLTHQSAQICAQHAPTNFIAPDDLSRFDREHLRAAFKLIKLHQEGLSHATSGGRF